MKNIEYVEVCNDMLDSMRDCAMNIDKFIKFQYECKGNEFEEMIKKIDENQLNEMEEKFERYTKKLKSKINVF